MRKLPQNSCKITMNISEMYNKCFELNGGLMKVNKIWVLRLLLV